MKPKDVIRGLVAAGYQAQVVKLERLDEMAAAIAGLKNQGCFEEEFYHRELQNNLNFDYTGALPGARSIVVVAAFQPPTRVRFGGHALVIPPTYLYRDIWENSLQTLAGLLEPAGYGVARARIPLKTLAVRSGLGKYGRNNICYIPGMGSFHRLGAFYTEMPCEADEWRAPEMMDECRRCHICRKSCPTGAIGDERFVIDAGRCLTYFNENPPDFPSWVKPSWHNAVFGCMLCQKNCPLDRVLVQETKESPLSFDEHELRLILEQTPLENLPWPTQEKLHALCLDDDYALLARNIGCLLPT
jgi:epoxyqueuosine reductase